MAVVGFLEQFVNVTESDGQALLEIGVISGTLQRDLTLELLLVAGTALGMMYVQLLICYAELAVPRI